jgi:putative hemolysin
LTTFLIILALFLSAIFSGSEIAYVSANKLKVELKKKRGTRRSRILAGWFDRPADFMSTMLVGNNIALVAFTILISGSFAWLLDGWAAPGGMLNLLGETIFLTLIVLVFGEYLPKTLFRLFADDALYLMAVPLRGLQWLLYFPSRVMTGASWTPSLPAWTWKIS